MAEAKMSAATKSAMWTEPVPAAAAQAAEGARAQVGRELSERDALTGLLNHSGFQPRFEALWNQALREGKPLAKAVIVYLAKQGGRHAVVIT